MPIRQTLLAFFLCASLVAGAEIRIQKDGAVQTIKGDLVSIGEKEIVLKSGAEEIKVTVEQVLTIDLHDKMVPAGGPFAMVELVDSTLLHGSKVEFKGKELEITLFGGQVVKVPLKVVSYWITDAQNAKIVQSIQSQFLGAKRRNKDVVIARSAEGQVNGLEGALGDASDTGETIEFELAGSDAKKPISISKLQGMIFFRTPDANQPIPICRLMDNHKNNIAVYTLSMNEAGLSAATPSGAKLEFKQQMVARLDFSKGKLTFLSDITPIEVVETNNLERIEHYRKDQNLEGQKISLGGKKYDKGLALHAYTALTYRLDGDYQFFSAIIGVDDDLLEGIDGETIVRIEGDGREIKTWKVARKDKPLVVRIPVKDVFRFKIIVSSGDLLDLGKHVDLADAKLSKQ